MSRLQKKTLGPPAPNHRIFLTMLAGETSETIVCHPTSNEHVALLDKEFGHDEQKSTGKRQKRFIITIMLHMQSGTTQLNLRNPKHKEFIDTTYFMCQMTIEWHNYLQNSCQHVREATQQRVIESIENCDLFHFVEELMFLLT